MRHKGPIYIAPAVLLLALFQIIPMFQGFGLSLFKAGPRFAHWTGFGNYLAVFRSRLFWLAVKNTLMFTIVAAPILAVLTFGIATVAFGMRSRAQWFVRFALYLPQIIASAVLSLVWTWIFNPDGALNALILQLGGERLNWLGSNPLAFWSIMIVLVTQGIGIPVVIFLGALTSVSRDLYEAAAIDGAGGFRQATAITLPMIFPVFTMQVAAMLISTMQLWALPYWLTGGGPGYGTYTLLLGMFREMAMFSDYGVSATYAVLTCCALVLLVLGQRRLSRVFA